MNETTLLTKNFEKIKNPSLLIKEALDKAFEESMFMRSDLLNEEHVNVVSFPTNLEHINVISIPTSKIKSLPSEIKDTVFSFSLTIQRAKINLIDLKLTKNPKSALSNSIYKAFCHNYYYYAINTVKHYIYPFNHKSKENFMLKLDIKNIKTRKFLTTLNKKFNEKNKNKKVFLFSDTNIFGGDSLNSLNFAIIKLSDFPVEIQKLPKETLHNFMQEIFEQSKYIFGHVCIFVEDKSNIDETLINNIKESLLESLMQSLFNDHEIVEYSVLLERVKQNENHNKQEELEINEIASVRLNNNYEIKFKVNKNYLKIKEFSQLQDKINKMAKDSMQLVQEYIINNPNKKIPNYKIDLSTERLKNYIKYFLIESSYILKQIKEV